MGSRAQWMMERFQRHPAMNILIIMGAASITLRILLDSRFGQSAGVYLAVPFGVAILLHMLVGRTKGTTQLGHYFNHMRDALVVMLGTSALLQEGFLCVLMFAPIYFVIVTMVYVANYGVDRARRDNRGALGSYGVLAAIAILSLEGVAPLTSLERHESISTSRIVEADIATLKANMARTIDFTADRPWFLRIFPLPESVEAGSLEEGDLHHLHFVYRKWFIANFHEGDLVLRITQVGANEVRTEVVENTTYFSHYMRLEGTTVSFQPLAPGRTEVTLTVRYERLLDPSWYFGPLQRLAVKQSAGYLIDTIIARSADDV